MEKEQRTPTPRPAITREQMVAVTRRALLEVHELAGFEERLREISERTAKFTSRDESIGEASRDIGGGVR